MQQFRKESDYLGEKEIPASALYGIHSLRAAENFPLEKRVNRQWFKALALIKKAYYLSYKKFKSEAAKEKLEAKIAWIDDEKLDAMIEAASELSLGEHYDACIVPAISGGAGTSFNMAMNEIISNVALLKMKRSLGEYAFIHPNNDANVYQSTNDVVPSALKLAILNELVLLEAEINETREEFERLEKEYREVPRIAFTQMQEAIPSTYGKLFSAYQETLSRDWWRISKCAERLKTVNLGGGAVGTGLGVPRFIIFAVTDELRQLSGRPLARAENLSDATSNLDSLVEVHAILKSHAVNLEKISSDLRLLASDLVARDELKIPAAQVGSSIMPSKINPVVVEFVVSVAHQVYANDQVITSLCAQGTLDLNAYLPLIGESFFSSLESLRAANQSFRKNLLKGLALSVSNATDKFYFSSVLSTALVPYIGYKKAEEVARVMKEKKVSIFDACKELTVLSEGELKERLKPSELVKLGFSLKDLL